MEYVSNDIYYPDATVGMEYKAKMWVGRSESAPVGESTMEFLGIQYSNSFYNVGGLTVTLSTETSVFNSPTAGRFTTYDYYATVTGIPQHEGSAYFIAQDRLIDSHGHVVWSRKNYCHIQANATFLIVGTLNDAIKNKQYTDKLETLNAPTNIITWDIIDGTLPNGLILNPDTGIISGTPV